MTKSAVKYSINSNGYFVIEDYNRSKVFSSFFPGVAGLWGIPMWVFYVNRGQGIASFGIQSKDKAIMEFQPANKSYRLTTLQGFRTFIKVKQGQKTTYWEPFQNNFDGTDFKKKQNMYISAHDLILEEVNQDLGLTVRVNYFTLPDEPYSALMRRVSVENTSGKKCSIEILDGMPAIVPFGLKDWLIKNLARTVEAWVKVRNLDERAPFYQLNVEVADTSQVTHITEGNFFFSFDATASKKTMLRPIVEATKIFGSNLDFSSPEKFVNNTFQPSSKQTTNNKTPCAFAHHTFSLPAGKTHEIVSVFGYARDVDQLKEVQKQVVQEGFVPAKESQNREIIDDIKNYAQTNSASENFNLYAGHTFLDNILRGGLPISVRTSEGNIAFNVYSRKHGDLERDYNHFVVAPTFYSQGNGNYRDVNQNRRNDVWFNADVKESHIVSFLNLSQADGYNPLVVKGTSFRVMERKDADRIIDEFVESGDKDLLRDFLMKNFQPGELLVFVDENDIKIRENVRVFLGSVLEISQKQEMADHGEGFWSDHWTYNLDLIQSYLSLYPERLRELLIENNEFRFYLNHHYVRPRDQRFYLTEHGVRQYESVCDDSKDFDPSKFNFRLKTRSGQGEEYTTNLLCKLLCLIVNKAASLDPSGCGVEMEADKPNWYDALNGLPGLVGSSVSETFELQRYSAFLLDAIDKLELKDKDEFPIFEELASFITGVTNLLRVNHSALDYWNKSNDIKENYRQRVRRFIDGRETKMTVHEIRAFLELVIKKTTESLKIARNKKGQLATYFYHEVTDYKKIEGQHNEEHTLVRPLAFKKHALPLFLEGYVHAMKIQTSVADARKMYREIQKSDLYDEKLKMYKVNTNLDSETEEIGRTRIFPSGWLENESVWLHMEYKFILEILRAELFEEFYDNFKNVFVPFQKPARYGRSILENSSFIVSSAHEDKDLHGRGFVARLSGSTAEFLHIWLVMNAGERPFALNKEGELVLEFQPALASWLFTTKATTVDFADIHQNRYTWKLPKSSYAFKFLNSTLVVYHNPKRKNTFGKDKAVVQRVEILFDSQEAPVVVDAAQIPSQYARQIRDQKAIRIDVHLG